MKMKRAGLKIVFAAFVAVSLISVLPSCKKNQAFKNETGSVTDDNKNIQAEVDGVIDEANKVVSDNSNLGGRLSGEYANLVYTPCGFTIDTTQKSQGILTFNFDGTSTCNNRIRSGKIKVTLLDFANGKKWRDAGAVLQMDYTAYKVTRTSDNKSLTFDGTTKVTNVEGGNWVTLYFAVSSKLVHKVEASDFKVTFEDGKIATCNLSRKFTYTWSNPTLTAIGEGQGTFNGISNLENWGTSREGDAYTSQVVDPVYWTSTCGANKPTSGKLDVQVADKDFSFTTTLGVNQSGNAVTSGCPWGLKVEWKYKNKTGQKLYQYN